MGGKHSRATTEADRKNGRSNGRPAPFDPHPTDPLADEKQQRQARLQQKKRERLRDDLEFDEDFEEEIDPDDVVENRARDGKKKKKREPHLDLPEEEGFETPPPRRRRKGRRAQRQWELDWDE